VTTVLAGIDLPSIICVLASQQTCALYLSISAHVESAFAGRGERDHREQITPDDHADRMPSSE
jgi:hypothetical protein